jgi:hypothetical protein
MNFDCYAITTWPGYVFQTALCIKSIAQHFPAKPIHVIVDTNHAHEVDPWPNFFEDIQTYLGQQHWQFDNLVYHRVDDVPLIDKCKVGWWRQQLVKLNLDQYLPGNSWLIVDADIIFEQTLEFDTVPVKIDHLHALESDPITIGNRLYVQYMLNSEHNQISHDNFPACASAVPFRQLDRKLLTQLRNTVEQHHNQNFTQLHLDLLESEQIVAMDHDCKKMVMSEFELIEVYRHYLSDTPLLLQSVQWSHTFALECTGDYRFRHSSLADWALGREWLEAQHLQITDAQWQMSKRFKENMPHLRK